MTDRSTLIDAFLARTPWADAPRRALAGDASSRRYLRIGANSQGTPAILMDADPNLGNDVTPFQKMTDYLRSLGLSAPEIFAADPEHGFLLLEDLGDDLFARVLESSPHKEEELYTAATDVLLYQHAQAQPQLDPYDSAFMTERAVMAYDWYAAYGQSKPAATKRSAFVSAFSALLDTEIPEPSVLIQRDYHAENLLWLPQRDGVARVGLLDYQDALLGHPAYDLVSMLKDARRDVSAQTQEKMIAYYVAKSGMNDTAFRRAYHVLGLQRNLRILGVFARLCVHFGKAHYVDLIPRVWRFIESDLSHPVNAPVADMLRADLPHPTAELLERLKDECGSVPDL